MVMRKNVAAERRGGAGRFADRWLAQVPDQCNRNRGAKCRACQAVNLHASYKITGDVEVFGPMRNLRRGVVCLSEKPGRSAHLHFAACSDFDRLRCRSNNDVVARPARCAVQQQMAVCMRVVQPRGSVERNGESAVA